MTSEYYNQCGVAKLKKKKKKPSRLIRLVLWPCAQQQCLQQRFKVHLSSVGQEGEKTAPITLNARISQFHKLQSY